MISRPFLIPRDCAKFTISTPSLRRLISLKWRFSPAARLIGSDFLQLHLQKIVAISCALRDKEDFRVWSLGSAADSEAELIRRFFEGIEKYSPQLVSWNGGGFDLPVLHYRSLVHGIAGTPLLGYG